MYGLVACAILFGLPVTRVFGEFSAKKKIPNVIIGHPLIINSDITNDDDYVVIASDSVWQNIKANNLKAVMQKPLSDEEQSYVLSQIGKKIILNTGNGSLEDVAENIRNKALLEAMQKTSQVPDATVMVIDLRPLHSNEK